MCAQSRRSWLSLTIRCFSSPRTSLTNAALTGSLLPSVTDPSLESSSPLCREFVKLLKAVAEGYPSIQQVLRLQSFVPLFRYLGGDTRRDMAVYLLEAVCARDTRLDDVDLVRPSAPFTPSLSQVGTFMDLVSPIVVDQAGVDTAQLLRDDRDGFVADQQLVARFITLLQGPTPDLQFQVPHCCFFFISLTLTTSLLFLLAD